MELNQIEVAVEALRAKVSSRADVYFSVSRGCPPSISIYANGIGRDCTMRVSAEKGDGIVDFFARADIAWEEHVDQHRATSIRAMALAIIEITAAHGSCSDAALRMKFPSEEIARYGADAVKDANAIASNGPFSISVVGGDNGAPNEAKAEAA